MRVDPLLGHEHVRTVALEQRRHDGVECAHVRGAIRVRGQRNVDAVPRALAAATLVGRAGSGEERTPNVGHDPVLVQADGEHLVGVVERGLDTVAVMRVDVDVCDLHPTVGEQAADDRRVVVDAEAGGVTAHRVVQAAGSIERDV